MTYYPKTGLGLGIISCGSLFLIYALASVGDRLYTGVYWLTLVLAFVIGASVWSLRRVWLAYLWSLSANICIAIAIAYFGEVVPGLYLHYGFFGNANFLGCAVAIGFAAALAFGPGFLPILAFGLCVSQSRGAILASGIACLIAFWPRYKVISLTCIVATLALIAHFGTGRDVSIFARLGVWQDTFNHLTIFGSGLGSFFDAYTGFAIHTNMTEVRPAHVYNDFLETIFELGIGAIPLWVLIILACEGSDRDSRLIIITFLILGLTFFPLYTFPVGHLSAMALGYLARSRNPKKETDYGSLAAYCKALPQRARHRMGVQRSLSADR